jgi:hypothetical protein
MPDNLGELEQLVMLALLRLGEDAYGIPVQQELARVARRHATFATVYSTLQRLETKGFVKSRLGDPTPERGGRRKKFFAVTGGRLPRAPSLHASHRTDEPGHRSVLGAPVTPRASPSACWSDGSRPRLPSR